MQAAFILSGVHSEIITSCIKDNYISFQLEVMANNPLGKDFTALRDVLFTEIKQRISKSGGELCPLLQHETLLYEIQKPGSS